MPSWGMILEPKKRYKQNVQNSYQITHAVLDLDSASGKGHSDVLMTIGENTFILCTLSTGIPQTQLNMRLAQGDQISFATRGEGTIHLTGYILEGTTTAVATNGQLASGDSKKAAKNQKNSQKKDDLRRLLEKTISDEDDESDDADFSDLMRSMDGLEDDDDDDDGSGEEEEDDDEMGDDSDVDEDDDDEDDDDDDDSLGEEEEDDDDDDEDGDEEEDEIKEPPTKKGKKEQQKKQQEQKPPKQQKQQQQEKKDKKDKPAAAAQTNGVAKEAGKVQTLNGGVKIKDLKEGSGAFAKPGKNVVVYYEGRLQSNNKMFDSCKQGAGFKFQLGRGTVIRGWDIGVSGMRVGGKRQITCPPGAAYGQRGSPPVIPPNSTLVFDVELRNVQ